MKGWNLQMRRRPFKTTLRASNHPLSRSLYNILKSNAIMTLEEFQEHTGKGIEGKYNEHSIKVGSASYVGENKANPLANTTVYVSADEDVKGRFVFKNTYRDGMSQILRSWEPIWNWAFFQVIMMGRGSNCKSYFQQRQQ